jgi:serine/threonine protein kinase
MLNDSNIVSVMDFEVTATEALVIMEYIDGPDLATLMRASTELFDLNCVAAIARDIGNALIHAHSHQVLHLDIKPANILFDPNGYAKVTDFGMAVLTSKHGYGLSMGGTVGYMPPEQIESLAVDERTDLWAFAILLYQLLVGNNPYLVADADESLTLIETLVIPLPSQVRDELNPEIDRLFISALSAEPNWRQSSIKSFLDSLLPMLGSSRSGRYALRRRIAQIDSSPDSSKSSTRSGVSQNIESTRNFSANRNRDIDEATFDNMFDNDLQYDWHDDQQDDGQDDYDSYDDDDDDNYIPVEKIPFWQRIQPSTRSRLTRLTAAVLALATTLFGLTGFGIFGFGGGGIATGDSWRPVGGTISTSGSTSSALTQSEFQAQLIIVLGILFLVALVAFIAPSLGAAISMLFVCAGILARGLVIVAALLFVVVILWWLFLGRRGWTEATLVTATIPLTFMFAPFSLPMLAGSQLKPLRAFGTVLVNWLIFMFVSPLTVPGLFRLQSGRLFSLGWVINKANHQFPPALIAAVSYGTNWIYLLVMLLTCAFMLFITRRKAVRDRTRRSNSGTRTTADDTQTSDEDPQAPSRLRITVGAVLATILLAAGLIAVPLLYGESAPVLSTVGLALKLGVSMALVIVMARLRILVGYNNEQSEEN